MAHLIKGVSQDLAKDYTESYKDPGLKYKFTVSAIFDFKRTFKQFVDCTAAAESVEFMIGKPNNESNWYTIFLNRVDGSMVALEDFEIEELIRFEDNPVVFELFHRIVIYNTVFREDLHMTNYAKVYPFGPEEEEDYDKRQPECVEEEFEYLKEELSNCRADCDQLLRQLKLEIKSRRDTAMMFIQNMSPRQFQERLLYGKSKKSKLPKFQRAVEGDEDYIDTETAMAGTDIRLSKNTIDRFDMKHTINFGFNHRDFLRFMTEEEFIKLCYYERDIK